MQYLGACLSESSELPKWIQWAKLELELILLFLSLGVHKAEILVTGGINSLEASEVNCA